MTDRPSSRPPSPLESLERYAKTLRQIGWQLIEIASGIEQAAKVFRGEKP